MTKQAMSARDAAEYAKYCPFGPKFARVYAPQAGISAGRKAHEPVRETDIYPRLRNIGGFSLSSKRPLAKPTPANLRRFARTVYPRRAINAIKDPISRLDWEIIPVHGASHSNSEIKRQIEIVTNCFMNPNHDDSFRTLIEQVVDDILTGGAGAIEQQKGGDAKRPLWMWPVDGLSIQIYAGWNGSANEPRYIQTLGYGNIGGMQGPKLRNDELIYFRKDPTTESPFGWGAVETAFQTINRQLGVADFAGDLTVNANPENMIFMKNASVAERQAFQAYWRNEIEGRGMTPVASGEAMEILRLRGGNDDALYLKYQEFIIREIATAFGVTPMNLGIESDVNRNTAEVSQDRDWNSAIIPVAVLLESHFNRECIQAKLGFSRIAFRFKGLRREDEEATARIYKLEYQNNACTPNEWRQRRGLAPIDNPWADLLWADYMIAQQAAKGAAAVDDPDLKFKGNPNPKTKQKGR